MHIIISNEFLGTKQSLLYDGSEYRWVADIPPGSWQFGYSKLKNLSNLSSAMGINANVFSNSPHGKSLSSIIKDDVRIPWLHVLPSNCFQKLLSDLVDQLWMLIGDSNANYYMDRMELNRETLEKLYRPLVNVSEINRICDSTSVTKVRELKRFKPESGSMSPKTVYNLAGSITGRLTVLSGPNILTLKKSYRSIFSSRFKNGKIVQVDISSLEPRIALSIAKKKAPDDIYSFVRDEVLGGKISRNQAKVAVLSCIYGGGAWSIAKQLSDDVDPHSVMTEVKSYFDIPRLLNKLKSEYNNTGMIKSLYGRPIKSGDSLVNHYLQSTGVDVSFDVFRSIIRMLDKSLENNEYCPVYVIHDAIVIDASENAMRELYKIQESGINVDILDENFPVKVEIIKE